MSECRDRDLGALLHAYELKALPEEESRRFELHLMECDHCFEEFRGFERKASLLYGDEKIRTAVRRQARRNRGDAASSPGSVLRRLWPEGPLFLKPGILYLMILLLLVPASTGLRREGKDGITTVQTVTLSPTRSGTAPTFQKSGASSGLLEFVFREAVPGEAYSVIIEDEDGGEVYRNEGFSNFDEYETGRLSLPLLGMETGGYRLVVTDPRRDSPAGRQEYRFRIEE